MTITPATKRLFIFSLLAVIIFTAALAYILFTTDKQGRVLDESVKSIQEGERRQEAEQRTKRTFDDSKDDRAQLKAAVFADANDSILSFVSNLETFATRVGVEFTVVSFGTETAIKNVTGVKEMKLQFSYKGTNDDVINFSRLLESVPYVSRLDSLTITSGGPDLWQAQVTMVVLIRTI